MSHNLWYNYRGQVSTGDTSPFRIPATADELVSFTDGRFFSVECSTGTGIPIGTGNACIGGSITGDTIYVMRVTALVPTRTYVLEMRVAHTSLGVETLGEPARVTFNADPTRPGAPELVFPQDGASVSISTPKLDWDVASGNVESYSILIRSGDIDTGLLVIDVEGIPASATEFQVQFPGLDDAVHEWRVTAVDEAGNTADSLVQSFRLDTVVAPALLLKPPRFVGDRTPPFGWSHPGDDSPPVTFTIQVIKSGDDFENGPFAISQGVGTDVTFEPVDPLDVVDEQDYLWRVIARDSANPPNVEISEEGLFTLSTLQPSPPILLSPVNDTAELNTTFKWDPDGRAKFYTLVITADDTELYRIDDIPHVGDPGERQEWKLLDPPAGGSRSDLDPGIFHLWSIRGKTTGDDDPLAGNFAASGAFITLGDPIDLYIDVALEGTGLVIGDVAFTVDFYSTGDFTAGQPAPWLLFQDGTVQDSFGPGDIDIIDDLDANPRTYRLRLKDVALGFFDITVHENFTLDNLADDLAVHAGLKTRAVDIGELVAGNAANDPRRDTLGRKLEIASIINALDASVLVAAYGTDNDQNKIKGNKRFDSRADFKRPGGEFRVWKRLVCEAARQCQLSRGVRLRLAIR